LAGPASRTAPTQLSHLRSGVMRCRVARVSSLPHQIHTTPSGCRRIVASLCYDLSCKPWGLLIPRMLLLYARRPGVISRSPVLSPTSCSPLRDSPPAFSPRATLRVYNAITHPHWTLHSHTPLFISRSRSISIDLDEAQPFVHSIHPICLASPSPPSPPLLPSPPTRSVSQSVSSPRPGVPIALFAPSFLTYTPNQIHRHTSTTGSSRAHPTHTLQWPTG